MCQLGSLGVGNSLQATIQVTVSNMAQGSLLANRATATDDSADPNPENNSQTTFTSVPLTAVVPLSGGQLNVNGVATFTFPANTFTDTVIVDYYPVAPLPSPPDIEVFFKLTAVYSNTGLPAQLAPGQTINAVVHYEQNNIPPGVCENHLSLFGWIGKLSVWQPTPSIVNINGNLVTAELDRLGVSAILGSYCVNLPVIRR
jgi:hypothetical protein